MAFPTDQVVTRPGQVNNSGDVRALFLKLFAGEVLRAYHAKNIMRDKIRTRTIRNGKSASFPLIGTASAKYHTPGQLIEASSLAHSERVVTVDDLMISPVFIANIDEAMNHFDVRQPYSEECGVSIADIYDRTALRMACKAGAITNDSQAQAAGLTPVTGEVYTSNITLANSGDETDGNALVKAIFDAKTQLDEASITTPAYVILRPAQYYALFNATDVTKLTWMNKDVGGTGSMAEAKIPMIAGMAVHMSVHLPETDESSGLVGDPEPLTNPSKYRGDYSKVVGIVMTQNAVCAVHLFDLSTESEYQMDRQGTLMLAKMACGFNILRPAEAVVIYKA